MFLLFVLVSAFAVWMSGSITWAVVAVGAVATVVFFDWYRMGHMQVLTLPETHRTRVQHGSCRVVVRGALDSASRL